MPENRSHNVNHQPRALRSRGTDAGLPKGSNTMYKRIAALALSAGMALPAASLHAVELAITARAATQALVDGAFKREGKYDLLQPSKCTHAYLETPQVTFANDRMVVRFHLSARAAQDVGGRCMGPDDRFWVTVSATPVVA